VGWQLDRDFESTPVTVLGSVKAGGFGTGLHWSNLTPVHIPRQCGSAA
jgi:hypothetical protein